MIEFGQQLGNTVLNIFMNTGSFSSSVPTLKNQNKQDCVTKRLEDEGLRIIIYLISKTDVEIKNHDVIVLDILHTPNKLSDSFSSFEDVYNDNRENLSISFSFLEKFIVSCCSLSPYLNFNQSDSNNGTSLLQRHFVLNYDLEYKTEHEILQKRQMEELQGSNNYSFHKTLANSTEILSVNLKIIDNVDSLINKLREKEFLLSRNGGQKLKKDRFLSEENMLIDSEINSSYERKEFRYSSTFGSKIKHNNRKSLTFLSAKRPFKFVDEEIFANHIHEDSEEEHSLSFNIKPDDYEMELQYLNHPSSFFNSTGFSFKSKKAQQQSDIDFTTFGTDTTINNLYYILNSTKKSFATRFKGKSGNYSLSSKSNKKRALNTQSNNSLAKKVIISFLN